MDNLFQVIQDEIEEFGDSNIRSENDHDPALKQQQRLFNEDPLLRKHDRNYYTDEARVSIVEISPSKKMIFE